MEAEKGPFRILFVDDDLLVLEVWQAILASAGYDVKATSDPQKAVEFVRREDFDLVITDSGNAEDGRMGCGQGRESNECDDTCAGVVGVGSAV